MLRRIITTNTLPADNAEILVHRRHDIGGIVIFRTSQLVNTQARTVPPTVAAQSFFVTLPPYNSEKRLACKDSEVALSLLDRKDRDRR